MIANIVCNIRYISFISSTTKEDERGHKGSIYLATRSTLQGQRNLDSFLLVFTIERNHTVWWTARG